MSHPYKPIDLSKLRTLSVHDRRHKADVKSLAQLPAPGASVAQWLASLPDYLGAKTLRSIVTAIADAVRAARPVVAAFGAHVIKVGCGPILVDLVKRRIVSALVANGACAIHDVELALTGQTSEEVADTIRDGSFGMVAETLDFFDAATAIASRCNIGLGEAIGRLLIERKAPNREVSVFAAAVEHEIPITVHVAFGTDTVHVSPRLDGAALGAATLHDFRLLCDVVADLGAKGPSPIGGVWLNIGSAVLLPEVFLKAVSVARNLGANLDALTTANLDMIRHYRPNQNVVSRPVMPGRGHELLGHHEIMLPLLRQAVIDSLTLT
ncbi:MAG: hypothetical protein AABZ47_12890 [Planctomycetota bacterium]